MLVESLACINGYNYTCPWWLLQEKETLEIIE